MSKEKKDMYKEECRQRNLRQKENKKLLEQGVITKEELKKQSEERRAELKRKREERDANNATEQPAVGDESGG